MLYSVPTYIHTEIDCNYEGGGGGGGEENFTAVASDSDFQETRAHKLLRTLASEQTRDHQ